MQDEASQLAAVALTRVGLDGRDTRWLDLCAGPGGKARLLAGLAASGGAHLLAADARPHRARLVRDAAGVTGAAGAVVADAAARPGGPARSTGSSPTCRALVSARCAAGRRHAGGSRPPTWPALGGLQRRLLGSALDAARPGGVVAYVTCSPHLAETREVVADVLARPRRHRGAGRARRARRGTGPALPGTRQPVRAVLAAPARHATRSSSPCCAAAEPPRAAAVPAERPRGGAGRAAGSSRCRPAGPRRTRRRNRCRCR